MNCAEEAYNRSAGRELRRVVGRICSRRRDDWPGYRSIRSSEYETRIARGIGGYVREAQIGLAFATGGRVASGINKKLNSDWGVRRAVQSALNCRRRGICGRGDDHRRVLQRVRARVSVTFIIWRDSQRKEIHSQAAV